MTETVLCAKPDCEHRLADTDCVSHIGKNIYYHNGYCYTTQYNKTTGKLMLIQIIKDGTSYKELFEINIPTLMENSWMNIGLTFVGEDVYIYSKIGRYGTYETSGDIVIRKRSLDGKKDEIIYTYNGERCFFEGLRYYGGYVFFTVKEAKTDENTKESSMISKGIFAYSIKTGGVVRISDRQLCDYTIDTEKKLMYYYVTEEGLYKKELSTGEDTLIKKAEDDSGICYLSFDGNYIYLDNERWCNLSIGETKFGKWIKVLDKNGEEINTIELSATDSAFFGDDRYLFLSKSGKLGYISKDNIANEANITFIE